jgi:hypothetical protein
MSLTGQPYMLRESGDDPNSPWRSVAERSYEAWRDRETDASFSGISVEFYGGGVRIINESDDVEAGFLRPPWWPDDVEPPEWPRR